MHPVPQKWVKKNCSTRPYGCAEGKKNLQDHESHLKLIVRAGGHHKDPEVLQWPHPTEPNYIWEEKGDLLTELGIQSQFSNQITITNQNDWIF